MAQGGRHLDTRDRGLGRVRPHPARARRHSARLPAPVRRRGHHHQDGLHGRLGRAFGLLSALVSARPAPALLIVPALVLGALVFFLNGSLLLIALRLIPDGRGDAAPETAVVVAAGDVGRRLRHLHGLRRPRRRCVPCRLSRLAYRRRRGRPADQGGPGQRGRPARSSSNSTASATTRWSRPPPPDSCRPSPAGSRTPPATGSPPASTDWSSDLGASQLADPDGSYLEVRGSMTNEQFEQGNAILDETRWRPLRQPAQRAAGTLAREGPRVPGGDHVLRLRGAPPARLRRVGADPRRTAAQRGPVGTSPASVCTRRRRCRSGSTGS
ncbi:hypothetical protein SCALM49S_02234 [Streptomyces californicus]